MNELLDACGFIGNCKRVDGGGCASLVCGTHARVDGVACMVECFFFGSHTVGLLYTRSIGSGDVANEAYSCRSDDKLCVTLSGGPRANAGRLEWSVCMQWNVPSSCTADTFLNGNYSPMAVCRVLSTVRV